jgi:uncharacterized protein (TIGR02217 family)
MWSADQGKWNVGFGIRDWDDLYTVYSFFQVMRGKAHTFRFKDWLDFKVTTQMNFGTGNGTIAAFQLKKTYDFSSSGNAYIKTITKPLTGTILIYVAASLKTEGTDYNINYATGIVTFIAGHIPTSGQALTWQGEHDKHTRFDSDEFRVALEAFDAGDVQNILIIEEKET